MIFAGEAADKSKSLSAARALLIRSTDESGFCNAKTFRRLTLSVYVLAKLVFSKVNHKDACKCQNTFAHFAHVDCSGEPRAAGSTLITAGAHIR